MRRLHLPSYLIGLGCGIVLLLVFFGAKAVLSPASQQEFPDRGAWQRGDAQLPGGTRLPGGDETARMQRMAENFSMTVEELENELKSGKTIAEIAGERGVELPFAGRRMREDALEQEPGSGSGENTQPPQSDENGAAEPENESSELLP